MNPITIDGYNLIHEGSLALADAEHNGIRVDYDYILKKDKHLERQIKYYKKNLNKFEEIKKWKKVYNNKFNLKSSPQLQDILYNHFKYKTKILTKKRKPSVSEEALEQLNIPVVKKLIELRKLQKAKNTYVKSYINETVNNYLHPFFCLDNVRTFRSSSQKINFQNQPKRNPIIKKIVRRAVIPRKDHVIIEADYSGIEVAIAACYNKDKNLINDIINPNKDMHRDMAMKCYLLDKDEWTKQTRQETKNKFVFPEFYGDYYATCAEGLWLAIDTLNLKTSKGIPLKKHLKKKGINNYKLFEKHIERVENYFWNKRYKTYSKWKDIQFNKYCKNGYVDILTGFRCKGYLPKNKAINYPIQGAAFHCLLWSFIRINKWIKRHCKYTKVIGQIHDSIVIDVHKDELNKVLKIVEKIMTKDILKYWKWIILPLEIEIESTPLNGSWYDIKEVNKHKCKCNSNWMYKITDKEKNFLYWKCPICNRKEK